MHIGKFLLGWTLRRIDFKNDPEGVGSITRGAGGLSKAGDENQQLAATNLITSEVRATITGEVLGHKPVLDLDFPCVLLESTSGNGHLLIDKQLSTEDYDKLLKVMTDIGLYNKGCYDNWKRRGYTGVRTPWCLKTEEDKHS